MDKKYLQSLSKAVRPGDFRCLPKRRSSETFSNPKYPPKKEYDYYEEPSTAKKRSSISSITSFRDKPEVDEYDKEKPVVIVVVVNKRSNAKNGYCEGMQNPQQDWQTYPMNYNNGDYLQQIEEILCKCAAQRGLGLSSPSSRSGNSPTSTKNADVRKQLRQFKQSQQCLIPQNQPQQYYPPQQQSQQYYQPQQQSQQYYQPQQQSQQCYQPQQQSQQCYQPQQQSQQYYQPEQQYYQPQQQSQPFQQYQQSPPAQLIQVCYQPQLNNPGLDQQTEQPLNQPEQSSYGNGSDIYSSPAGKERSPQPSCNGLRDTEYCRIELPVCVTKSTFQKLQSAGINKTQPLDSNSQYLNEKCTCASQLNNYEDSTKCTCKNKPDCVDYCTCMEKRKRPKRRKSRRTKCKNMCFAQDKPTSRVILRDIQLPSRCCMRCPEVPCCPCSNGCCCNAMW